MKKIAIIYSGAKYQGGVEDYLHNLFRRYDKTKVELLLVSMGRWPLCGKVEKTGARVFVLSGGRVRPQTFFDIKKIIKSEDISLLVSQGVVANFYARISSLLSGVPHLAMVPSDLRAEYPNPVIRFFYQVSDYIVRPATEKYIAFSWYLKERLVSKGVEKGRIEVVYNAVEVPKVKQKKSGEIVIGSFGRLDHVKGYDNLIKAFSTLRNADAKLVIWGEGGERKSLEELIKDLGLTDSVSLPGYTNDTGKALSQMDIYIQSSLSEGFGIAVVEAMLAKKLVIVTPAGALKELVEDGKTGFMAKSTRPKDIAEAIEKVFDNFENLSEIAENAEEKAKRMFSLDKFAHEVVDIYLKTATDK